MEWWGTGSYPSIKGDEKHRKNNAKAKKNKKNHRKTEGRARKKMKTMEN